ncbi:MAG: chitobiase/beta-hexosaminidase C-terminal domain-containing protein [Spirochaetales bacterium]|nr:chitobiase/beta-hexosaminidase C-terminal domain-containing protein [Spirochaetales bacterium]
MNHFSALILIFSISVFYACDQSINVQTEIVDPPSFDHTTGKYADPFDLVISHTDPSVQIWYTIDGTNPVAGEDYLFDAGTPIAISDTTEVRAVATKTGLQPSQTVQRNFTFPWKKLANLPQARTSAVVALISGMVYVAGGLGDDGSSGYEAKDTLYRYNTALDSWEQLESMPGARYDAAGGLLGGKLYVIGGSYIDSTPTTVMTSTVYVYDPSTTHWSTDSAHPLSSSIHAPSAATSASAIWVSGGYATGWVTQSTITLWDPTNGAVAAATSLPAALAGSSTLVYGDFLYVFGGEDTSMLSRTVRKFDMVGAGGWTTCSNINTVLYSGTNVDLGSRFAWAETGDSVYLFGGYHNMTPATNIVRKYNISGDTWTTATRLPSDQFRASAGAVSLSDGTIIVVGGQGGFQYDSSLYRNTVYRYYPLLDN